MGGWDEFAVNIPTQEKQVEVKQPTANINDNKQIPKNDKIGNAQTNFNNLGVVCLLYGDTSAGKSFASMSFPEPITVIDTEGRAFMTAAHLFRNKKIDVKSVVEFKTEFDENDNDPRDTYKIIENITKEIITFANKVKSGEIPRGSTFVIDSVTDVWSDAQDWGIHKLAMYVDKKGNKRADEMLMRINNQTDWRIINKKYSEIIGIVRHLAYTHGINVVLTARMSSPPEYLIKAGEVSNKDTIRAQKDTPFMVDYVWKLQKKQINGKTVRVATCEKFSIFDDVKLEQVQDLDYDKMKELIKIQYNKIK